MFYIINPLERFEVYYHETSPLPFPIEFPHLMADSRPILLARYVAHLSSGNSVLLIEVLYFYRPGHKLAYSKIKLFESLEIADKILRDGKIMKALKWISVLFAKKNLQKRNTC